MVINYLSLTLSIGSLLIVLASIWLYRIGQIRIYGLFWVSIITSVLATLFFLYMAFFQNLNIDRTRV